MEYYFLLNLYLKISKTQKVSAASASEKYEYRCVAEHSMLAISAQVLADKHLFTGRQIIFDQSNIEPNNSETKRKSNIM